MSQNAVALGARYFVVDLFGGIAKFPFWWYSNGLVKMAQLVIGSVKGYAAMLSVRVWIKNIFVPMYGERDIQGRIISFFIRVVQILVRSFALFVFCLLSTLLFLLYLALPLFVLAELLYHGFGVLIGL